MGIPVCINRIRFRRVRMHMIVITCVALSAHSRQNKGGPPPGPITTLLGRGGVSRSKRIGAYGYPGPGISMCSDMQVLGNPGLRIPTSPLLGVMPLGFSVLCALVQVWGYTGPGISRPRGIRGLGISKSRGIVIHFCPALQYYAQISRPTDTQVYGYPDLGISKSRDTQAYGYPVTQAYGYPGLHISRSSDIQVCRDIQVH